VLIAVISCACRKRTPPVSAQAGVYRFGPAAPASPARIVSLAPNMTEILFAVGAGDRVVGVTRFCDHPEGVRALPKVGGFLDVSVEAVAAQRPSLVVGVPNASNRAAVSRLGELGFSVLLAEAHTLADVVRLIEVVGGAVGRSNEARSLVASMRARVSRVTAAVQGARRPRVLFTYGRDPLVVAGPSTFAGELIALAGGENIVAEPEVRYRPYNIERVLRLAPEVLIDSSMGTAGAAANRTQLHGRWARFPSLPAVVTGRLHWVDPQIFARPGPRLAGALESLARLLHPDRMQAAFGVEAKR
jgi:iron complex transport system substrate-binding protein